ncbi:atrial natriuretic peptide receptor 2-like [Mya arenaria]|uniref:atrial natriuretic peptide receptor 2-like n=1 Tax=Mya arenaria TaxID=6604 RepID=UPI0022E93DC5|nr:atrial natriuretic peptide receptor 2-like [Mya arenaria]
MANYNNCCFVGIILAIAVNVADGWHAFDNTEYHCWDLTASATNPVPVSCEGFELRWVSIPGETIRAQDEFSLTFEFIVNDAFYTFAVNNGYFDGIGSVTTATEAKTWCETTVCPEAKDATKTNCCIWHVNVHSCPLADTTNGLCGPWISPSGSTFTHSEVLVGSVNTGNWTCHVAGLYQTGVTSLIAHFRIAGIQMALETKTKVTPRAECGNGDCESDEGEDCESCPKDCGKCPLKAWQIGLIAAFSFMAVLGAAGVILYFQIQKRKLLWDESWIVPLEDIKEDEGMHGGFGSMLGSTMDLSTTASDGTRSMAVSAAKRQVFVKTAMLRGRTVAVRHVRKKEFTLTKKVRLDVRAVRECDNVNLCRFLGASIVAPNIRVLTEYCPKGSLSDVLLNDDIPLNWAFRFSFAADVSRGMQHLHNHHLYHGRLKSNNCVVDDRWTVKITDYGLRTLRENDDVTLDGGDCDSADFEDDEDEFYQGRRARIYIAPEFADVKEFEPTAACDVYAFAIILIEIATRNDPYGDEDAFSVPAYWKPPFPDLSPDACENKDDICPCAEHYLHLIDQCWDDDPEMRPTFDAIKKTIHRINPSKLSPVDLMMAMMEKYSKHLESIVTDRTQDLVAEKAKTDRLLYSMLPKAVADDLRLGKPIEAKYHNGCTIYFSDIVGFTTISGGSTAMEVVGLLNKLYITFDEIIDKYNVYKVETIGDAYMVVSGIPLATPYHAREIADMSIDLVAACKVFTIPHMPGEPLKIRVGLHSGSACAGVVGLKMPRYCLFGDTVNTASRMESNGEAYRIHISNFTYEELVKLNKYTIEQRGKIPVKGKGEMMTWWLTGYDPTFLAEKAKLEQLEVNQDDNKNSLISMKSPSAKLHATFENMNSFQTEKKSEQVKHFINHTQNTTLQSDMVPNKTSKYTLTDANKDKVSYNISSHLSHSSDTDNCSSETNNRDDCNNKETGHGEEDTKDTPGISVNHREDNTSTVDLYNTADSDCLFTPVEMSVAEPGTSQRKISRISNMTSDSGFTDRSDDVSDVHEIVVRSCSSLQEILDEDDDAAALEDHSING